MIDSDRLEAFIAFGETLSFTAAARALHISQPALHSKIGKLAGDLGVALYQRSGRSLALTPEGLRLLAFARDARERDGVFVDELRGVTSSRAIVLAAGEGALLHLLGPALKDFMREHAGRLEVLVRDGEATLAAVRRGEAHLGVATLGALPDDLAADVLARVGAVVVMPRSHRLAPRRALALEDLAGERLIVPPPGRPHRETLSRALLARGIPWTSAVEATGWELQVHLASLGLGLAIVNAFCRIPKGVVARPLRGIDAVTYHAVRRRGAMSAPVAALRKHVLAAG